MENNARDVEKNFQAFFGNRKRLNEIDPRFLTRDLVSLKGWFNLLWKLPRLIIYESLYEFYRHTVGRDVKLDRPIIMSGMPHSGTSISMRLVASHPELVNFSEANTIIQPMGYLDWGNGDHVKTDEDATEDEVRRLNQRFAFHCFLFGKKRFLNKSPMNTVKLDFFNKIFPDCVQVMVIRDGRAVVNSLMSGLPNEWEIRDRYKPWKDRLDPFPGVKPPNWRELLRDNPIEQHALQWTEVTKYALETIRKKNLKVHIMKYEDLCANTRENIKKIYELADLPVTPEIMERIPKKLENKNFKWKKFLNQENIDLITSIQKEMMIRLGYRI